MATEKNETKSRQYSKIEQDEQYSAWHSQQTFPNIDDNSVRANVKAELDLTHSMSVEEFTLWAKWHELRERFPGRVVQTLWGPENQPVKQDVFRLLDRAESMIWSPDDPDDYLNLEPELLYVGDTLSVPSIDIWGNETIEETKNPDPLAEDWRILRNFISTGVYGGTVGRSLNHLVRDRQTKRYLGIVCLSSDFMDLGPRDKAIGWDQEARVNRGKLQHTAIGSTIVPTQPLGFNYVGGKLCALLCLSEDIADRWQKSYGDILVGVTTTALYGGASQYSGLKHWKGLGSSEGSAPLKLNPENEALLREWMRVRHPKEYWRYFVAQDKNGMPKERDATHRSYQFCYRQLGFKPQEFTSKHKRGVYFGRLYQETDAFLRDEITEDQLNKLFVNSTQALSKLWKTRYPRKRIEGLKKRNRVNLTSLFYRDLIGAPWEDVKAKYLDQVGR